MVQENRQSIRQQTFKLTIEYDGSNYHGWQRQLNQRTIQGEIEKALETITGRQIPLIGSGRTDAGVHALGQTASFRCRTRLDPAIFQRALNSLLSSDIVIRACEAAAASFHARFDARAKTYQYRILNRSLPSAVGRQYAWFIRQPLDLAAMRAATRYLIGTHDFKAFEGAGSPRVHTIRKIFQADLTQTATGRLVFEIRSNGFLRFMVRNIVGTLAEVGSGRLSPDDVPRIMASRDRSRAGATAPPHGLFLVEVCYDG